MIARTVNGVRCRRRQFFWNLRCFFSWTLFCCFFCMHPPACMNGRKKISRPKNGRILPLFGGLKSDGKKKQNKQTNLNRPRRHWWAPLGSPTPSWRPPDHILPPSLTFLPSAEPSPSNVENNINYRKNSHNIPKIPPKFPTFDPHILKEYDSDIYIFLMSITVSIAFQQT